MIERIKQDRDNLIWIDKPRLIHPYMILGFEGWPDAGRVSSGALAYLNSQLAPILFAKLRPDDFYSIQLTGSENKRPRCIVENGIIKSFEISTLSLGYTKDVLKKHDLILIYGPEPEQSWEKFVQIILDVAAKYKVEKIVTIGGTFDAIPHTVATRITASVSDSNLIEEIKSKGIELVNYSGPSSIHTLLVIAASKENISTISLWGHTPHYIQVPNTMGCYDLLVKLDLLLDLHLKLEDSRAAGERLYEQIDQAMSIKPELRKYLKILEMGYHKENPGQQQSINQNIVKEIEKLLNEKLN
jgi:proteasome assembly chaperone (PAC2) family protein